MVALLPVILKNHRCHTQILRGKRSLIYRREVTPETECFDVFLIKIGKSKTIFGKQIPERELYPTPEDFGSWAWSYHTLKRAIEKFEKVEKGEI